MNNQKTLRWFLILADISKLNSDFMFKMALLESLTEKQEEAVAKMVTGFRMESRVDKFTTDSCDPYLADELEHEDETCAHSGVPITDDTPCVLDKSRQAYLSVEAFKALYKKTVEVKPKKSAKDLKKNTL